MVTYSVYNHTNYDVITCIVILECVHSYTKLLYLNLVIIFILFICL